MAALRSGRAFVDLPDPGRIGTLDEVAETLGSLKVWAGNPSYETITARVNAAGKQTGRPGDERAKRATVTDCFKVGRRRLNTDLVIAVVRALRPDEGYVAQWRQALRVVGGETGAEGQVRVAAALPPDLVGFTGRAVELRVLRQALRQGRQGDGAVVISAIAGMAGVGKTRLAVHAAHLLAREKLVERVLFVNLRGFHPDPAQPPADPGAVLDGFLSLLGVPAQHVPHDTPARTAAYRDRLAGTRTLVVLDNAATTAQIRPLLPETPGCLVLITSRRQLADLHPATHLRVDVFTPEEAVAFLAQATPGIPVGDDSTAAARIAHRCGYLPLALGLVAGHIRGTHGWTLTDHADRLDERHQHRHLDTGVQLALDLSYQHLPTAQQRLLRLAALQPGQDLDAHAAAALTDTDLCTAGSRLDGLCRDHLLHQGTPGRYALHDLVRAHAAGRADDQDPPADRRAALTRLFDYYLATTAAAMKILYPAEAHRRPDIRAPGTPTPALTDPDTARVWLDTERPCLVAVAAHSSSHGWPGHTTRLSSTLYRYLDGGHSSDALTIHGHALHASRQAGDLAGQGDALINLGSAQLRLSRYEPAAEHFRRALPLVRRVGDRSGQARALAGLGAVEERLGRYGPAIEHLHQALDLHQQTGDRTGEARCLGHLGHVEGRLGRYGPATGHLQRALALFRQSGDRAGEADALIDLGAVEGRPGRHEPAIEHFQQALSLYRQLGNRDGEADALDTLGALDTRLGRPDRAVEHHQQALALYRETGNRDGETWALNGLGEAAHTAGRPADALTHHTAAHTIAADIDSSDQRARAHAGLGRAHHTLGDLARARQHYQHALSIYTSLGMPDADQLRAHLTAIGDESRGPR
jgi:tetratricopeptide (TPR) repeat protein